MRKTDADLVLKVMGQNIKDKRKSKCLKQIDLAEKIGTSRQAIVNIECGHANISILRLIQIADELECDVNDLLPKVR